MHAFGRVLPGAQCMVDVDLNIATEQMFHCIAHIGIRSLNPCLYWSTDFYLRNHSNLCTTEPSV